MGYLANTENITEENIRRAIIYGSVMASFNVEAFSLQRLHTLKPAEIKDRYYEFRRLTQFEDI